MVGEQVLAFADTAGFSMRKVPDDSVRSSERAADGDWLLRLRVPRLASAVIGLPGLDDDQSGKMLRFQPETASSSVESQNTEVARGSKSSELKIQKGH